ncbi:hypothetical protein E1301_Tti009075 [Triplophysa tibetana]|uniref:Uncharacterized protein n=1 Tax=Triplophysa tibetana TaxID=1572043 RepID=A0A5A9PN44_9TELE|nr:hypothetical protein E1301_Tti009075 [Triplophysa tibetana]
MKWLSRAGLQPLQGSPQGVFTSEGSSSCVCPPLNTSQPIIQLVLHCMGFSFRACQQRVWSGSEVTCLVIDVDPLLNSYPTQGAVHRGRTRLWGHCQSGAPKYDCPGTPLSSSGLIRCMLVCFGGVGLGKAAVLSAFGFQMVNAAQMPLPFPPPLLLSPPLEYQIDRGSANSVRRDQPCMMGALPRAANFPILYVLSAALGAVHVFVCVEWEEDVKYSVLSLDEPQQPWSGGFILTLQVIAGGALTKHPAPTNPPIEGGGALFGHIKAIINYRLKGGVWIKKTALLTDADMAERSTNLVSGYNSQKSARGTQSSLNTQCPSNVKQPKNISLALVESATRDFVTAHPAETDG